MAAQQSQAKGRHDLRDAFGVACRDASIRVHEVVLEAHAQLAAPKSGGAKTVGFIGAECANGPVKLRQNRAERPQPRIQIHGPLGALLGVFTKHQENLRRSRR